MKKLYFSFLTLLIIYTVSAQKEVDILIIGGGAGGTSAGIQSARMGAKVQIIEATPWLGGMLTSAGVSAIDGNHEMPSGIWGEFRQKLRDHYGDAEALATGWVSHTLFEPSVGNQILQEMATIPNLDIAFNAMYTNIDNDGDGWSVTYKQKGKTYTTRAKLLMDATEIGELLPLVGADFRLGMDSQSDTGEKEAPETGNSIVQDLTYVLILKDVSGDSRLRGNDKKGLVKKPKNYDPKAYECACKRENGEMFNAVSNCQQMLNYGKLPNNKYMMNWPNCGNDFYLNWPELNASKRKEKLKEAKAFTQGFVYYIQNELGFKNLRVAEEFPTKDNFPMIPYDREARRIKGKTFLTVDHLEKPYDFDLYKTGVAVGDYPIDHHHDKNPDAPEIEFINIKVPSYNIPLGSLIPEKVENFIVAEKNISVSNIVNGATRLQPVVLGIGQAAGTLAAMSVKEDKKPSEVSVRKVQNALLESNAYLMPFIDVKKEDDGFAEMQRIGAAGVLKGFGVPYKWANQTWFYPERIVSEYEWKSGMLPYYPELEKIPASGKAITLEFLHAVMNELDGFASYSGLVKDWFDFYKTKPFDVKAPLNRRKVSIITDQIFNPFSMEIDFEGNLKTD
ncbi:FAD-dependent oxidoreductase [Maribacter algarum]|uniref:FAD-dependent oxidoreductase n=1 Tax=Maribacter algarum (ex Zhang et al. 2020) TaxID=2578118 RepID=A0A5S3PUI1_9FLAO|nr:FAD-dependent oxidoreductase [Maribacter algarum]TMM58568.1 FAD-dependent oxidoreductase [Maribacter algarum]